MAYRWLLRVTILILSLTFVEFVYAAGADNAGGGCYNMEIIALKSKSADMSGSNGHSILPSTTAP